MCNTLILYVSILKLMYFTFYGFRDLEEIVEQPDIIVEVSVCNILLFNIFVSWYCVSNDIRHNINNFFNICYVCIIVGKIIGNSFHQV